MTINASYVVNAICALDDGKTVVVAGKDGHITVFDFPYFHVLHEMVSENAEDILSVKQITGTTYIVTGEEDKGGDGPVKIWDIKTGRLVRNILIQKGATTTVE